MLLNCGVAENSWEFLDPQGDSTSLSYGKSVLNILWSTDAEAETPVLWSPDVKWLIGKDSDAEEDWRCEEKGMVEDEMIGMASSIQWTWVWVNSGSWWWTGRPDILQSMELQSQTWLSDWTETELRARHPGVWSQLCYQEHSVKFSSSVMFDFMSPCRRRDSQDCFPTPQFKSINFQCSTFFLVQFSHPYMTTSEKSFK